MSDPSADDLIDDILRGAPAHTPGTRPIHAPGICATGRFQATPVAPAYTDSAHFAGGPVPVTVRFSNGTPELNVPDAKPRLVRGMAVKFHLFQGTPEATDVDMVGMTVPTFFIKTVDRFEEFAEAVTAPVKVRSIGQRISDILTLRLVPDPADAGIFEFARRYPSAAPAVAAAGNLLVPESYATASYNTVHAFTVTGAGGARRSVRFRWEPVEGVRPAPAGTTGNFLQDELRARIDRQGVEFVLRMQVADQGDDTADPTRPWPGRRCRVVMGHLRLTAVSADQVDDCERLSFDPCRLVPGIAPSDDPILAARGPVYQRSWVRRTTT
jgi:catalase